MFFTLEDRERGMPQRVLQEARDTGRSERTGWCVCKDGTLLWMNEVTTALHDASGALIGFSTITRDDTARHNLDLEHERTLHDAHEGSRLKDEFLSTVSHELRTPLNAILGWTQLIRLRPNSPETMTEGLAVIERSARAQARLIDDLLDVSRIVTGKTRLTLAPIALASPLWAAVETIKPAARQKDIELLVRHDVLDDEVIADSERLQQVILNLLSNAIKFTPIGGLVIVKTSASDDAIEMRIIDSGIGIDRAFLPFVFDRFRQADTVHTREQGGLGLGLSIVKHLVEMHGGSIAVESAGRGHGTTVRLELKRALEPHAARGTEPSAPVGSPGVLRGLTVLIVDDDMDARRILELVVTDHGARAVTAATVCEGVSQALSCAPDVVLADLSMPRDDGFSLLSQLRTSPDPAVNMVPVIAITAHAHPKHRDQCFAAGFDGYVSKPFDVHDIVELIAELSASRR